MLVMLEGFDWINVGTSGTTASNLLAQRYPNRSFSGATVLGRNGAGAAINFPVQNQYLVTQPLKQVEAVANDPGEGVVGMAIKTPDTFSNAQFLAITTDPTQSHLNLRVSTGGEIQVYRTFVKLVDTGIILSTNTWYYIECKFKIGVANGQGEAEIKLNGASQYTGTGLNLWNSNLGNGWDRIYIGGMGNNTVFDDMYVLDDQAGHTDFLDPIHVTTLLPNADGSQTDWDASDSTTSNFNLLVDEVQSDGDTTYISSSTAGDRTVLSHDTATPNGVILGVMHTVNVRADAEFPREVSLSVSDGTTTVDTRTDFVGSTDYVHMFKAMDVDPNTSATWTTAGLNGAEFGTKIE